MVNPAAVIGPGDHYLISSSMIVEFAKRPVPVVTPGGLCVADVDAIVAGHLAAAERGRVGERYILGGENLTAQQIAAIICQIAGRPAPRYTLPAWLLGPAGRIVDAFNRINPRPPVVSGEQIRMAGLNVFYDSTKAVRELSHPLLPFRGAVERAYVWYRQHGYLA